MKISHLVYAMFFFSTISIMTSFTVACGMIGGNQETTNTGSQSISSLAPNLTNSGLIQIGSGLFYKDQAGNIYFRQGKIPGLFVQESSIFQDGTIIIQDSLQFSYSSSLGGGWKYDLGAIGCAPLGTKWLDINITGELLARVKDSITKTSLHYKKMGKTERFYYAEKRGSLLPKNINNLNDIKKVIIIKEFIFAGYQIRVTDPSEKNRYGSLDGNEITYLSKNIFEGLNGLGLINF